MTTEPTRGNDTPERGTAHAPTTPAHMCVGTTCWVCGEPDELKWMREDMRAALYPHVGQSAFPLARVAALAIRDDVVRLLDKRCDHKEIEPR